MNSREQFHTEKTDIILKNALKNWVDSAPLPVSRRENLLRTAQSLSLVSPGKFGLVAAARAVVVLMLHALKHGGERDPLWAYSGSTDDPLNGSNSPFHISMLQLSTLYLTPLRLGVSSFVL